MQDDTRLTERPDQRLHGEHLQPQEAHGLYRQSQETHGLYRQSHGLRQQSQEIHGLRQQPQKAHGLRQQSQETHSLYTRTIVEKVGTTVSKLGVSMGGQWVVITALVVVVLGTSGAGIALAFHLFPHQPVMSVVSGYNAQGLPVAADGTTLHVHGQKFAANSPITFQLDTTPLKTQQTQSDGNGNVTANLAVTSAWRIGRHTLTARDASNTTTSGIEIEIVRPGQSNTPGPNGAPADDASFTIQLTVQGTTFTNDPLLPHTYTLKITGHPDPAGGTVCASRDDGTPTTDQADTTNNNGTYTQTATYSCSGTYKGGMVSYAETLKTQTVNFSSTGSTCNLSSPQPILQITGSYTNEHNFSGSATELSIDTSMYACNPTDSWTSNTGDTGSWTGTVSQ
ncbi:MAG: hypothetical protein JOZ18_00025 [Chloroflexi bacterium]|nr:hypothetical protein [Chloroflexota bacterium]